MIMTEITLVIIDDHPLFRQGVVDLFAMEPWVKIVGEAATGEEGLDMIRNMRPDVAIVDVNLPKLNGMQVTHQVISEKVPTRIILLTGYDDSEQIIHAAWSGAAAYCAKDIEPEILKQVIKDVMNGKYFIGGRVYNQREFDNWLGQQMESARHLYSEPGSPFHPLSDREMEVLSCVVQGKSNKEIAVALGISHQTVKNHVTAILRKFGVEDRTQAVVYALKRGWVQIHDQDSSSRE